MEDRECYSLRISVRVMKPETCFRKASDNVSLNFRDSGFA